MTAAVTSKEGEGMILTTGAIPAAKGAIAALNEVGRISADDQKYLLDVMENQASIFLLTQKARTSRPAARLANSRRLYS